MSDIQTHTGLAPHLRDQIELRDGALTGDMIYTVTPATTASSAAAVNAAIGGAAGKFTRDVVIELTNAAGTRHTWANFTADIAASETTAGDGTSDTEGSVSTLAIVNGVGTITLEYIGTWTQADDQTLTVSAETIMGYTVAQKTSVDTLGA